MSNAMWDQIAGKWKQLRGDVRTQWGDLTDDEVEMAAGQRDKLAGLIQERYGRTKEEANHEIDRWAENLKFD